MAMTPPPPGSEPPGPVYAGPPGTPGTPDAANGLGTASLILGILGVLGSLFVIGGLLGLIGLVLGLLALGRVRRGEATNRGAAIGGIVTSALAMLITAAVFAVGASFLISNKDEITNFTECIRNATTEQERQACTEKLEQQVGQ